MYNVINVPNSRRLLSQPLLSTNVFLSVYLFSRNCEIKFTIEKTQNFQKRTNYEVQKNSFIILYEEKVIDGLRFITQKQHTILHIFTTIH